MRAHPELLWVRVENGDDVTRLRLTGRLDVATVPYLDDKISEARGRDVVLDLGGLTYLDGSASFAVTAWERRVQGWGGKLRFENALSAIRQMFDGTAWDLLHVADSEQLPEAGR